MENLHNKNFKKSKYLNKLKRSNRNLKFKKVGIHPKTKQFKKKAIYYAKEKLQ